MEIDGKPQILQPYRSIVSNSELLSMKVNKGTLCSLGTRPIGIHVHTLNTERYRDCDHVACIPASTI